MAINVKKMLADGMITICTRKHLEEITIQDLLNETGVSRQTFYNHFKDKNDLIQYIYETKIIPDFNEPASSIDFQNSMVKTLNHMKKNKTFMKQACMMEGQNCLKDYMFSHCQEFDLKWHEHMYGKELPEALKFATIYHANASSSMTLSWILSDMVVDCEQMATMMTNMRAVGMDVLFKDGKRNPYEKQTKLRKCQDMDRAKKL